MILPLFDQFFGAAYVVQAGAIAAAAHSNMARRSRKGQVAQERQFNSVTTSGKAQKYSAVLIAWIMTHFGSYTQF